MTVRHLSVIVVCTATGLSACGSAGESGCTDPIEEPIDPSSAVHVLDPADGPTDAAPTSGPHIGVGSPGGLYADVLPSAIQLRVLEGGQVIVQYRDESDRDELVEWRDDETTVAPNPDIDSVIVATAWGVRMNCESVDTDALADFVDEFARAAR